MPRVSHTRFYRRSRHAGVALAAVALVATGCADTIGSLSQEPIPPAEKIDQLSEAMANRFTSPERLGRFELARRRLVRGALVPSRVFSDTAIWTSSPAPDERVFSARGALTEQGYRFEVASDKTRPTHVGDTRHVISLTRLTDNQFRWVTVADCAIGQISAADVTALLTSIVGATESASDSEARAAVLEAYPRTSAVLAHAFSIDTFTAVPGPQNTTFVHLTLGIHTDRLKPVYPNFAAYVDKYVNTARYRFTLSDRSGGMLLEIVGHDRTLSVRFRAEKGHLVTYAGPPRPMGDSLRLTSDFTAKVKLFTVGYKNLVTDFIITEKPHERSWLFVAHTEPSWLLPLGTEHLVRTPLRRPFEGGGATFQLDVHDSAGSQTVLSRRAAVEMQESAIYRSLAGIVGHVFDDLGTRVEPEEAQFLREVFVALQHDAVPVPKIPRATHP